MYLFSLLIQLENARAEAIAVLNAYHGGGVALIADEL